MGRGFDDYEVLQEIYLGTCIDDTLEAIEKREEEEYFMNEVDYIDYDHPDITIKRNGAIERPHKGEIIEIIHGGQTYYYDYTYWYDNKWIQVPILLSKELNKLHSEKIKGNDTKLKFPTKTCFSGSTSNNKIRIQVVNDAMEIIQAQPIFLDTETTGLGYDDQIVEIAVIDFSSKILLNTLVKPTIPIPKEASNIHGITDADVAAAPRFDEIVPCLVEILNTNRPLVIYNSDYDMRMLLRSVINGKAKPMSQLEKWLFGTGNSSKTHSIEEGKRTSLGSVLAKIKVHCAMKLYAQFHGDWNENHKSFTWQKLSVAARQLGIDLSDIKNIHRALADAEITRRIMLYLAYYDLSLLDKLLDTKEYFMNSEATLTNSQLIQIDTDNTEKNDYDKAVSDYTQAIKFNSTDANAYRLRGVAYCAQGKYDFAISDFTQMISLDPGSAYAYNNRGAAYAKKGNYEQAILDFTRAIALDPNNTDAYRNLELAYAKKAEHDKANAGCNVVEMLSVSPPAKNEQSEEAKQSNAIAAVSQIKAKEEIFYKIWDAVEVRELCNYCDAGLILSLKPLQQIKLVMEHKYPHGPVTICVMNAQGRKLGYVARDIAFDIAKHVGGGIMVEAVVSRIDIPSEIYPFGRLFLCVREIPEHLEQHNEDDNIMQVQQYEVCDVNPEHLEEVTNTSSNLKKELLDVKKSMNLLQETYSTTLMELQNKEAVILEQENIINELKEANLFISSELKDKENSIKEIGSYNYNLYLLCQAAQSLLCSLMDITNLLQVIKDMFYDIMHVNFVLIYLADNDKNILKFSGAKGIAIPDIKEFALKNANGLPELNEKEIKPFYLKDIQSVLSFCKIAPVAFSTFKSLHGTLVVPLFHKDNFMGLILLGEKNDSSAFSDNDFELLNAIVPLVTNAIVIASHTKAKTEGETEKQSWQSVQTDRAPKCIGSMPSTNISKDYDKGGY